MGNVEDREKNLPDDGHKEWDWPSKYKNGAWVHIIIQFSYLCLLLLLAFVFLYLAFSGRLYLWYKKMSVNVVPEDVFRRGAYCIISGFLGGVVFGIKILYKAVASGRWHLDRVLWRIATPWVSLALSIVISSIMAEDVFSKSSFVAVSIGFFAGYFSESAIGKLYEIANLLFK